MSLTAPALVSVWCGLLALERRAFLQAALSRPLPASVGVGLLLGDVTAGLMIGLVFELLSLGGASLGGAHPDHELLPAASAAALASVAGAHDVEAGLARWAVAVVLCAPLGIVGRVIETALDARARRYLVRVIDAADHGQVERAVRQNLRAMWPHFVIYGGLAGAVCALSGLLTTALAQAPAPLLHGLALSFPFVGTVAAAAAVHSSQGEGRLKVAGLVALLVALVLVGARAWA